MLVFLNFVRTFAFLMTFQKVQNEYRLPLPGLLAVARRVLFALLVFSSLLGLRRRLDPETKTLVGPSLVAAVDHPSPPESTQF